MGFSGLGCCDPCPTHENPYPWSSWVTHTHASPYCQGTVGASVAPAEEAGAQDCPELVRHTNHTYVCRTGHPHKSPVTTPILNVTLMLSSLTVWVQTFVCCWNCPHLCSGLRLYEHISIRTITSGHYDWHGLANLAYNLWLVWQLVPTSLEWSCWFSKQWVKSWRPILLPMCWMESMDKFTSAYSFPMCGGRNCTMNQFRIQFQFTHKLGFELDLDWTELT